MGNYSLNHIVSYVLDRMGHPLLAKDAINGEGLSIYVEFIKRTKIKDSGLNEFINYFL